jgi:hypothetical protein
VLEQVENSKQIEHNVITILLEMAAVAGEL